MAAIITGPGDTIEKPKGGGGIVTAPGDVVTPSRASQIAKGALEAQQRATGDVAEFQNMPFWQRPLQATGDVIMRGEHALLQGWDDKARAGIKTLYNGKDYATNLEESRRATEGAGNRFGNPGTLAALELATNYKALPSMVSKAPNFATRIGTAATEGAALGAAQAGGHDQDMRKGAEAGAMWGLGGGAVGEAADVASRILQGGKQVIGDPSFRQELWDYGKDAAITGGTGYLFDQLGISNPYLTSVLGMVGKRMLPQRQPSSSPSAPPPPGAPSTQLDMFNNAQRAQPPTGPAGVPDLRDILTRLVTRGGIQATGP